MTSVEKRLDIYKARLNKIQEEVETDLFNQKLITEERQLLHNIEYWEAIQERV